VSFDASSDVFPQANRKKYIHSVGTVSAVKFVKTGGSYTGLFEGADHGLVRFSAAAAPTPADGYPPGLGMKLFRDGLPSANFMAMPGLDNQACSVGNFFAQNFTNHLHGGDGFAKKLLAAKFWQASYCPKMVGLSDLAAYTQDGKRVEKPEFPFHLNLVPSKGVDVQVPCDDYQQGLRNFATNLKPGTRLFDAYTQATPTSEYELIGYYEVTGSGFSTTKFGDDALFFKHQYMEEDFQVHPEWLGQINKGVQCGMDKVSTQPPRETQGCSAPFSRRAAAQNVQPCPFALRGAPCPH